MSPSPTVVATWTRTLASACRSYGVSFAELASGLDVPADVDDAATRRLPCTVDTQLWARAARLIPDPRLGLEVIEHHTRAGSFGAAAFVAMTCRTADDALRAAARHYHLVSEGTSLHYDPARGTVRYGRSGMAWPPQLELAVLAGGVKLGREWTGGALVVDEVRCTAKELPDHAAAEAFFGCRVHTGASVSELVYDRHTLGASIRFANRELHDFLVDMVSPCSDIVLSVMHAVQRSLPDPGLSVDRVASELGFAPRTLQRRLRARGTTFQELVGRVRIERAQQLLAGGDLSIRDVADRVGFTHPDAFRRAFKRQTGSPPRSYRALLRTARRSSPGPGKPG